MDNDAATVVLRRPNAKDALRARAVEMRAAGWSVTDIAIELGVAKSTAWRWVRHLPLDLDSERARRKRAHSKLMTDAQWAARRVERDARRTAIEAAGEEGVGSLSNRELLLLGAAIYWCEGKKAKPWRPDDTYLVFTNSDPTLLALFLRFVEVCGVSREQLSYRLSIHESADIESASDWWVRRLALPRARFQRPTVKRHSPRTVRHNTGAGYRGCLVIRVPRSRELYWRLDGVMRGLAAALETTFGR